MLSESNFTPLSIRIKNGENNVAMFGTSAVYTDTRTFTGLIVHKATNNLNQVTHMVNIARMHCIFIISKQSVLHNHTIASTAGKSRVPSVNKPKAI